jgi:hypothetical protein
VLCAVLGVLLGASAFAQTMSDVGALERAWERSESTLEAAVSAFAQERAAYLEELEAVDRYKQLDRVTPFDVIELRAALQRANTAALAEQDARVRQAEAAAQAARDRLVVALRSEIAAREAAFPALAPSAVFGALAELNALQTRVAALARPVARTTRVSLDELIGDLPETAEEMLAAADELDDRAARLERELEALRRQLDDALVDARLADRVNEFGLEESLFDDGAGRPSRARSAGVVVVATADEDSAGQESPTIVAAPGGAAVPESNADAPTADMGAEAGGDFGAPESAGDDSAPTRGGLDGAPAPMPTLGAEIREPAPSSGGAVRVEVPTVRSGAADPTMVGAGSIEDRVRRQGGSRVDALRAIEASLTEQLAAARRERDRLRRTADLLDE